MWIKKMTENEMTLEEKNNPGQGGGRGGWGGGGVGGGKNVIL